MDGEYLLSTYSNYPVNGEAESRRYVYTFCLNCVGTGILHNHQPCPECAGKGKTLVSIKVPRLSLQVDS